MRCGVAWVLRRPSPVSHPLAQIMRLKYSAAAQQAAPIDRVALLRGTRHRWPCGAAQRLKNRRRETPYRAVKPLQSRLAPRSFFLAGDVAEANAGGAVCVDADEGRPRARKAEEIDGSDAVGPALGPHDGRCLRDAGYERAAGRYFARAGR